MNHSIKTQTKKKRGPVGWIMLVIGILVLAVVVVGAVVITDALRGLMTTSKGGSAIDIFNPQPLEGETAGAEGQLNFLLAGNSSDDPGHGGADLTDSIMVASVDGTTKKLTLISIPRDLWVQYGGSSMKINAVYPKGGMPGLASVVKNVTGLSINQTVLVNYTALTGVVDAVGGIDFLVQTSDPRGIKDGNNGLTLPAGMNHLDGATVLKLARARNHPVPGTESYGMPRGDYDREDNQRKIIQAIISKVKSVPTLSNPLTVMKIFDSLSANVRTDMTVSQIRHAYDVTSAATATTSVGIIGTSGHTLLTDYTSPSAGDALVPKAGTYDYSQIQAFVAASIAS